MSIITGIVSNKSTIPHNACFWEKRGDKQIRIYTREDRNVHVYRNKGIFAVSAGIGLADAGDSLSVMNNAQWETVLKGDGKPNYGHFVICRICARYIELINDNAGVRTFYYYVDRERVVFSTLIREITDRISTLEPNWNNTGSLLFNQFIPDGGTEIENIARLRPGERLKIDIDTLKVNAYPMGSIKRNNWSRDAFIKETQKLTTITNKDPVLLLSGGWDSRVILSFLLNKYRKIRCISIGKKGHFDREIAEAICRRMKIDFRYIDTETECTLDAIYDLLSYNGLIPIMHRAGSYMLLNSKIDKNEIALDGVFGEFYKHDYRMTSQILLYLGSENYMKYRKQFPPIFNRVISSKMKNGRGDALGALREEYKHDDTYNSFQRFIIAKYLYPSCHFRDQARIDKYYSSFTLYSQYPLITKAMNPPQYYSDKDIMHNCSPLTQFPLAQHGHKFRFGRWKKVFMKAMNYSQTETNNDIDTMLKSPIMKHILLSSRFYKHEIYNQSFKQYIDKYFLGDHKMKYYLMTALTVYLTPHMRFYRYDGK